MIGWLVETFLWTLAATFGVLVGAFFAFIVVAVSLKFLAGFLRSIGVGSTKASAAQPDDLPPPPERDAPAVTDGGHPVEWKPDYE